MGNRATSAQLHDSKEYKEPQILHSYQKVIMRTVWRHMSQGGQASCGCTVMKRLLLKESKIKHVFHHTAVLSRMRLILPRHERMEHPCGLQEHQAEIVRLMQYVMSNLDSPSLIAIECVKIGRAHKRFKDFGLKTEYWDLLGEALTETIREYQGWRRHRESLRAANLLVSFLVDRIRTDPKVYAISVDDFAANASRKSSLRRKESVRFNQTTSRNSVAQAAPTSEYINDSEEDQGCARAGRRASRKQSASGGELVRSRSAVASRKKSFESAFVEEEPRIRRKNALSCPHIASLERLERLKAEAAKQGLPLRKISAIEPRSSSSYTALTRCNSRRVPRTPTIDFAALNSSVAAFSSSVTVSCSPAGEDNPQDRVPREATQRTKRSLARYHSLDHGYHSSSSPSDCETNRARFSWKPDGSPSQDTTVGLQMARSSTFVTEADRAAAAYGPIRKISLQKYL